MTMVPAISISSMAARMASVARRSASIRSPRPMSRADAIAAASVTRTISSARSCSMATSCSLIRAVAALAARLAGTAPEGRRFGGEDDRVGANVADRPPGKEEVRQLLQRRAALRDDLELAAVEAQRVEGLHEEAPGDALEVEVGDAIVAH